MSDARRPVDELFEELLALPTAARAARLAALGAGDAALRAELASLLVAWDASGDFLARPVELTHLALSLPDGDGDDGPLAPDEAPTGARDRAGQVLGGCRLLRLLGSGGAGDVWLAEREVAGALQQVAVKVIRAAILSPDAMRRFRNECRVLAGLDHAGIARLIDSGVTDEGVPWLVTEYVRGLPLDRWCDERALDARGRVRLLAQACEAVRHLHRHGVLHRDLKPANLLVDEDGRVRLIDFGIARALEAAGNEQELTIAGLEVMTPGYASPEQLRGEPLSLASDVYALGVIAYRLLTGALPHGGRRRTELARGIETNPPRRPSEAASLPSVPAGRLRGDLDAILLTALRAEPERRYPSAEALREDLARHLDGRPVLARGDTFAYVAGRFARRHAAAVALAGVAVAALVGAAIVGLTLWQRAEAARHQAERQRAATERVRGFLAELLETADPAAAGARADLTVRQALDAAAARLAHDLADEPQAAAALHLTIGNAYANLGLHEPADEHLGAARAIYAQGPAADPAGLAQTAVRQCELALKRGDLAAADSLLAPALAINEPAERASARLALSRLRTEQSRLDEAAAAALDAATMPAGTPGEPALRARVASQLGSVRYRQGRYAEAESLLLDAHRRAEAAFGPDHVLTAEAQQDLGVALTALGRPQDAAAAFTGALAVYEKLYPPGHPEFAVTLNNLAEAESAAGRHDAALERFEQARAVIEANYGRAHAQWAVVVNGLAFSRWRLGQRAAADSLYIESVSALAGALGEHHPWTAVVRTNLARVRHELGRTGEARDQAERARADLEAAFPGGHVYAARPLVLLAELALAGGDDAGAAALLARADAQAATAPPGGGDRVAIGILAARLERRAGRPLVAEAILDSLHTLVAANPATAADLAARIAAAR